MAAHLKMKEREASQDWNEVEARVSMVAYVASLSRTHTHTLSLSHTHILSGSLWVEQVLKGWVVLWLGHVGQGIVG